MLEKHKDLLMAYHKENHDKELHGSVVIDNIGLNNKCLLILHHRVVGLLEFYIISKITSHKLMAGESPMRYFDYFAVEIAKG